MMMRRKEVTHQFPLPTRPLYPWLYCNFHSFFSHPIFFKISHDHMCKERPMHKRISELGKERVVSCSPDGCWLLLAKTLDGSTQQQQHHCHYFAFNPTTWEAIHLPVIINGNIQYQYGVFSSSSPTDPNCLVMLFAMNHPIILYCRVLGDSYFYTFNYEESMLTQTGRPGGVYLLLRDPTSFAGKIYAIGSLDGDLVQITVDDDELNNCNTSLISNRMGSLPCRSIYKRKYLAVSGLVALGDDELLQIQILKYPRTEAVDIDIYKFNFSTHSWENTTSLNGRSMFLSHRYSFSVDDTPNKEWSYIYFTDSNDRALYSYRVEDERLSYSRPLHLPFPSCFNLSSSLVMLPDDDIHNQKQITMCLTYKDRDQNNCSSSSVVVSEDKSMVDSSKTKKKNNGQDEKNCSSSSRTVVDSSKTKNKGKAMRYGGQPLLLRLSKDELTLIASKLSFVDYINFRCVNKVCASSTIGMRMRMNPFPPSLIYCCDKAKGVYNIVDSKLNHKLRLKIPEILKDYRIRCSKNGWLLMENNGAIVFFNPSTMETVTGPRCKESFEIANFTFLSKPSCSDCDIMVMCRITSSTGRFLGMYTAQPRRGEWRTFILQRENQPNFSECCTNPVLLNGSWYYLGEDGRLGRLQSTKDGGFKWEIVVQHTVPCEQFGYSFLSECGGGDLVSIFLVPRGVLVFRLRDQKWEQINTLGSYSIYASWSSSISSVAEKPEMANRIYFPRFYKNGLVYYSLNSGKFHAIGSKDSPSNLLDMYINNYAWIEPSWS